MKPWNDDAWADFKTKHAALYSKLDKHIRSGHCRMSNRDKNALLRELRKDDAPFLAANNIHARFKFARTWKKHGVRYGAGKRAYFVTLVVDKFAMSVARAQVFDVRKIQAWARQELRGFDFIGNVEIALYTNSPLGLLLRGPVCHFHIHAVVFDAPQSDIDERMAALCQKYRCLLPGRPAAQADAIEEGTLDRVLLYLVKAPSSNYRAYPKMKEIVDQWGEIHKSPTGKYSQRTKLASSGLLRAMRSVMQGAHLDKWILAGGRCRDLLSEIRHDVLRGLPHSMRSQRQSKFGGSFARKNDE